MKVFVDTSALLALAQPRDRFHAAATRCLRDLKDARFVVSDYVLDETLTRWITRGQATRGLAFVDALLRSPRYELVFVDRILFDRARQKAAKLAEHRLSFTDCTSAVFVEALRLDAIFSFDAGFVRVGLSVLPASH
ncbi:MAG: PIN domain-containing protein [Myxococcota bacterium]